MEDLPTFDGEAYCVKCKKKQPLIAAAVVKAPNGTYMAKGECPESGTKLNRIIGKTWPKND